MIRCKRVLGATDVKYGIICAGSKFHLGLNKPVQVSFRGDIYQAKMHSSVKGRIDGLSQMFIDNGLKQGEELELCYDEINNIIDISYPIAEPEEELDDIYAPYYTGQSDDCIPCVQAFNGEYYNYINSSDWEAFSRKIAIYQNTCYFLYRGDVVTCKFGDKENHVLIKNALKKTDDSHQQLFVNEAGIFVYDSFCDRGVICRLFDYKGKMKGSFDIKRTGRKSDKNCVYPFAYIVGDSFYCVSDKEYMVYRFNTGERFSSELSIPDTSQIKGLIVSDDRVHLRLKNNSYEQWYWLMTDQTLSVTNGQMKPVFSNVKDMNMVFLHPKQNIAWIESYDEPLDCSMEALRRSVSGQGKRQLRTYTAYNLTDGKATGQRFKVDTWYSSDKIIYFDGKVMYALEEKRCMYKIDLTTGEGTQLAGVFEANKFVVFEDDLYVTKDYGYNEQCVVSIPTEFSYNIETKLCRRLW